jgi:hypothetical protein
MSALNDSFLMTLDWNRAVSQLRGNHLRRMVSLMRMHTDQYSDTVEWMHPMMLGSLATRPIRQIGRKR